MMYILHRLHYNVKKICAGIHLIFAFFETAGRPLDLATITKAFKGARKPKVQDILDALTDLGRLTRTDHHHWQA